MTQTAKEISQRAADWRAANPDAWNRIESYALAETAAERKFSIRPIVERVRWLDIADGSGSKTRVSNSYIAAFTRMLESEHPDMIGLITRSTSKLDDDYGE